MQPQMPWRQEPGLTRGAMPEPAAVPGLWRCSTKWKVLTVAGRIWLAWCHCHGKTCVRQCHGDMFPPVHPHPGPWAEICVRQSHFLSAHCSFRIPEEPLSAHLPAFHTWQAFIKIGVFRSQSKGQVDSVTKFLFKSSSSRTCPTHLLARSLRVSESGAAIIFIGSRGSLVTFPCLSKSVLTALQPPSAWLVYT